MTKLPSLSSEEAKDRLARYGQNKLRETEPPSGLLIAASQMTNPLILILLAAAAITVFIGDLLDSAVILLAVTINTVLGFFQERKAQHSLRLLRQFLTPAVRALRDGTWMTIPSTVLVVGDTVAVDAGDRIPADGKIVEAVNLFVREAILTGESMPVQKDTGNQAEVFMGTTVVSGRGVLSITKTGMNTRLGSIASSLTETPEEATPLQQQLHRLAKTLTAIVLVTVTVLLFVGLLSGHALASLFPTAVALAVAAVPEGMVVTLTVILALGMQRILKRKAVVRKLITAETLGSVTTICIDKTGTLTEGVMRVAQTKIADKARAIEVAVLANNLKDPIELALWEWAQAQDHIDPQQMTEDNLRTAEIPFDSNRKFMAVKVEDKLLVKGAPEILLSLSNTSDNEKKEWEDAMDHYAKEGLRIIGVAYKAPVKTNKIENNVNKLTFIGLFGIEDPVRSGVSEVVKQCQAAGITIKVVTGDWRGTSEYVMSRVGLPIQNPAKEILEGEELSDISEEELQKRVSEVKLFCRVTPEQKLAIVKALQKNGNVVAMTGDGVNDALALKKANVGIVVGGASDVARDTADMVLLDSSFNTIVTAIHEGRVMFQNIRKVVLYLLSDAFTEVFLVVAAILTGMPLPLTATLILWINIISDGFPALALAVDPPEGHVMKRPPLVLGSPILGGTRAKFTLVTSLIKATIALLIFIWSLSSTNDLHYAQTMTFAFVGVGAFLLAFSLRSLRLPLWQSGIFDNRWLLATAGLGMIIQLVAIYHPAFSRLFGTRPLAAGDWGMIAIGEIMLVSVVEVIKFLGGRKK